MFRKKPKPAGGAQTGHRDLRKLVHDVRASQHAAKLNAEAAQLVAGRLQGKEADRLRKHVELLVADPRPLSENTCVTALSEKLSQE